jgi:cytochrome c oxidase subunit 2
MWSELPLFPEQASNFASRVDALYFFLVGVSAFFGGLIFFLAIFYAVKYRRRSPEDPPPPQMRSDMRLEVAWTVIPLILTMIMFVWGASLFFSMSRPPADALEIFVVGRQWMWKFQHPDGQREINQLHVPRGRPVKLTLASEDVIHSFFVPAFRVKQDAVPGRYTTMWFEPTKTGRFHLFCAEYCGTQHSGMIGRVIVLEPQQYEEWLSGGLGVSPSAGAAGTVLTPPEGSPADIGQKLFQNLGCAACHRLDRQDIGPVLSNLFGSQVRLQSGQTATADENYLRESILMPQAKIVAGFTTLMPSYQGRLNEEQLIQLIAYIKSLSKAHQPPSSAAQGGQR